LSADEITDLYYSGLKWINSTTYRLELNKTNLSTGLYEYSIDVW